MQSEMILDAIAARTGWNESSKLFLCLQYIQNQGDNAAFENFLEEQASTESLDEFLNPGE